jgi:hypothetical protein
MEIEKEFCLYHLLELISRLVCIYRRSQLKTCSALLVSAHSYTNLAPEQYRKLQCMSMVACVVVVAVAMLHAW